MFKHTKFKEITFSVKDFASIRKRNAEGNDS